MTDREFQAASERIMKWGDLPLEVTYRVNAMAEKLVNMDGKSVYSKYAILEDRNGDIKKAWLTSIIQKELEAETVSDQNVYIRSYGLKSNKAGTRQYHDFEILKKK